MSTEEVDRMDTSSEGESSDEERHDAGLEAGDAPQVYLPGQPLQDDERLVCDESAYLMLHQAQTGAPCLSFDLLSDGLGSDRSIFPHTAYLVAGTQAAKTHTNSLIVMKMSNLHQTSKETDNDDEDSDDSDEEDDKKPELTCASVKHLGCVNRTRATQCQNSTLVATWSELGHVNIWNVTQQLQALESPVLLEKFNKDNINDSVKPVYTFAGHQMEGFAIDWCRTQPGVLASGDCRRDIHIWQPCDGGGWRVDQRPLVGHTNSVEDIQWSPNERNVLASCSVDKTIRVWDTRAAPNKACMLTSENAHSSDVNVISWNKHEPFIASGGDDGVLNVWDLRQFQTGNPVVSFKHHIAPISSVEWHPMEASVLASAGEDNQVALWDLAVEKDEDCAEEDIKDLPPQLLFIHQGQSDIKELHWHPQIPGVMVTTAHSGFNIFKTISV